MNKSGLEFRRLMHSKGWTASQIAQEFGISQASLSQWSTKGCPASRALELARLLDVGIGEVEPCIYQPKPKKPRPRAPYQMIAFEGAEKAKQVLIDRIKAAPLSKDDLQTLDALVLRLSI